MHKYAFPLPIILNSVHNMDIKVDIHVEKVHGGERNILKNHLY